MNFLFFFLRLIALPFILVFFLAGGALYIILMSFAWLAIGEQIRVWLTYPDWRP